MTFSWRSAQTTGQWGDRIEVLRDGEAVAELTSIGGLPLLGLAMDSFVGVLNQEGSDG